MEFVGYELVVLLLNQQLLVDLRLLRNQYLVLQYTIFEHLLVLVQLQLQRVVVLTVCDVLLLHGGEFGNQLHVQVLAFTLVLLF